MDVFRKIVFGSVLALCVILLHINMLNAPFSGNDGGDDFGFIKLNGLTLEELPGIFNPNKIFGNKGRGWFYRPIFVLYVRTLTALVPVKPVPVHLAGLILHLVCILLFVSLLIRITKNEMLPWFAGLIFALYPWKNEAVNWFSANSTLLAVGFYLGALHGLVQFRERGSAMGYIAMLICFPLALMSKEDAQSLPLTLLLFDLFIYKEIKPIKRIVSYLPFLGLGLGYLSLEYLAYSNAYAQQFALVPAKQLGHYVTFWQRTLVLWSTNPRFLQIMVMIAIYLAIRNLNQLVLAWWWLALACLPVPLSVGMHGLVGSRFYYLPALPFSMFLVWWLSALIKERNTVRNEFIAAFGSGLVGLFFSLPQLANDPMITWSALLIVVTLATLLVRDGSFPLSSYIILLAVAVFTQVEVFSSTLTLVWRLVAMVIGITGHLMIGKNDSGTTVEKITYPFLVILLLWNEPLLGLSLFTLFLLLLKERGTIAKAKIGEVPTQA